MLDHYRCYDVEPRPRALGVRLLDQFGERSAKLTRLVRLCTPVRKTYRREVTPIARPIAHLACYQITEGAKVRQYDVVVRNQFGFGPLRPQAAKMLCVPTFKQVLH